MAVERGQLITVSAIVRKFRNTLLVVLVAVSVAACATEATEEEMDERAQILMLIFTFGIGAVIWILGNEVSKKLEEIRKTFTFTAD